MSSTSRLISAVIWAMVLSTWIGDDGAGGWLVVAVTTPIVWYGLLVVFGGPEEAR